MKRLFACFLILTGCGKIDGQTHEYDKYFQDFNSDLVALGHAPIDFSQVVVVVGDVPVGAEATCDGIKLQNSGRALITARARLSTQQEYIKKAAIYHEIGHCYLGLDHDDANELSIMGYTQIIYHPEFINQEPLRLSLVRQMVDKSGYRVLSIFR